MVGKRLSSDDRRVEYRMSREVGPFLLRLMIAPGICSKEETLTIFSHVFILSPPID